MPKAKQPARFYYGWTIAVTLAITETISWGIIYYAFTVFITPMERDLGWSRSELTGGFSLALLVTGVLAFPVGTWIDRHGARGLMTIGSILASLLVIAWSQVTDLRMFYLIWAGLGVCSAAILYEPAFTVMATWFVRRRSTALAVITFAAGLASTIFIPLSDALLNAFGWRQAILILGIVLAVTTIPLHALMLRRHPDDLGLLPDGDLKQPDQEYVSSRSGFSLADAVHSRFFWMLILTFGLTSFAGAAIRVHFIPFLIGSGINASTAALASGSIGIMQVLGRLIFAPTSTRVRTRVILSSIFALQATAMFALLTGASLGAVGVFVVIFGAAQGAQTLARASIIAELFGASHYGRISSVMSLFLTAANTAAPVSAAALYEHFGTYQPVLLLTILLAMTATVLIVWAKPDLQKRPLTQTQELQHGHI
jgi:sugar phosphate permease